MFPQKLACVRRLSLSGHKLISSNAVIAYLLKGILFVNNYLINWFCLSSGTKEILSMQTGNEEVIRGQPWTLYLLSR